MGKLLIYFSLYVLALNKKYDINYLDFKWKKGKKWLNI